MEEVEVITKTETFTKPEDNDVRFRGRCRHPTPDGRIEVDEGNSLHFIKLNDPDVYEVFSDYPTYIAV